ncbi:S-adenosylmethionine:tRNA ribosyltransferase-isomerase [Sanyastnella coralliicola]|uniref:S-adenosylmethionine:tRNA ribosyltransferase-isomerase n=1 Tax=Sanyastnella coralliicola TaxID=3069118 RepID=UPI0027BB10EA|nr:S-adenosylmethionine:tRNA ribosyltransferase-isomerase [Longitalea sp. SCSIO 12813]
MEDISISDFDYTLPEDCIPHFPAEERDAAKLLHYDQGTITDHSFKDLPSILKEPVQIVLNDTKVIHARVFMQKPTGGKVELFLLNPEGATVEEAMTHTGASQWWCMVGGARKWKEGPVIIQEGELAMEARRVGRDGPAFLIDLSWTPHLPLAELLDHLGKIPLPPYMQRDAEEEDNDRYQTSYASHPGSVAAPTAGLHFSEEIMQALPAEWVHLTLHVGAGTFRPVSTDKVSEHKMHDEECVVKREALASLAKPQFRLAIGTTSLRTLESLYWLAVVWKQEGSMPALIDQEMPFSYDDPFASYEAAMQFLLDQMSETHLVFRTSIMIRPGYTIRSIDGLFTNFHLPKSTLLLLVSALVGEDWRKIYTHALENGYRFLSYGDGSLLRRRR